jgi:hypothetical protein
MFSISIPMSESLDELSAQKFARPLTPLNSAIIQPSISPSPATTVLLTPASTPSIVVTPSSPSPSDFQEPQVPKGASKTNYTLTGGASKTKDTLTEEHKSKCADLNDGKWSKSSKGGDVFVVDGHGCLKKDMRSSSEVQLDHTVY